MLECQKTTRKYKAVTLDGYVVYLFFAWSSIYDDVELTVSKCDPAGYIIDEQKRVVDFDYVESIDNTVVYDRVA